MQEASECVGGNIFGLNNVHLPLILERAERGGDYEKRLLTPVDQNRIRTGPMSG
jgi:hypothetical protein